MPFTAMVDFWSDETRSQYAEGMSYTARTAELRALVERWVAEGKARWGGGPRGAGVVEGRG